MHYALWLTGAICNIFRAERGTWIGCHFQLSLFHALFSRLVTSRVTRFARPLITNLPRRPASKHSHHQQVCPVGPGNSRPRPWSSSALGTVSCIGSMTAGFSFISFVRPSDIWFAVFSDYSHLWVANFRYEWSIFG